MEGNALMKQQLLSWCRDSGADGETMKLATEDIEAGFGKEQLESYMATSLKLETRKQISGAIHNGLGKEIYERFKRLKPEQIEEALRAFETGVPQDVILDMITRNYTAHHMAKGLEDYKKDLAEFARGKLIKGEKKNETVEKKEPVKEDATKAEPEKAGTVNEEPESVEEKIVAPEPEVEEKPPVDDAPVTTPTVETPKVETPVEPAPSPEPEANNLVFEMVENNNQFMQSMLEEMRIRDDRMLDLMKEMVKVREQKPMVMPVVESVKEEPKENPIVVPEPESKPEPQSEPEPVRTPEPAPSIVREKVLESLNARKPEPTPEVRQESIPAYRPEPKIPAGITGITRMILMPDGTLHPIYVEVQKPDRNNGFIKRAARLFQKETPAKSLINQLIDGKLNPSQLQQILRAVRLHFSKTEIKDLIESDLPAEEMKNIIDVVLADKGQILMEV
ncbi:MAG: hypothetical protein IKQ97_06975 [Eubacterium sp.]|nr:hypothetical protein [Eubacterium sp.]